MEKKKAKILYDHPAYPNMGVTTSVPDKIERGISLVDFMKGKIVHDGCMLTVSGVIIDLYNPDPSKIFLEDIAHGLAYNCRWNGHTRQYWSVAQHCCMMYDWAPAGQRLKYLFHDAEEAYWGDMIKPLKNKIKESCPEIVELMERLRWIIYKKFNISPVDKGVKEADTGMLRWEFERFWVKDGSDSLVRFMLPEEAKGEWLKRYKTIRP